MDNFGNGKVTYVLTVEFTAVAWQVCWVGLVGLIFVVSLLFSNVISTLSLALTPISSVIVFHDRMNGVKVIALLLALGGFRLTSIRIIMMISRLRCLEPCQKKSLITFDDL